ncbi:MULTISPECIES: hypothetical protein [unclassified Janthinobacterium]|uniref:hypothetical protein n=1 Tax=unclassified Janthinobacterium TaxID=2610881 RepID=UPI0003460C1F|nr:MULTISPECIES: hypothetical protein [unclassified Janthinobacterium]MEC5161056.1 hypothetical protein [Janthinobacterium sp. CG_S6]
MHKSDCTCGACRETGAFEVLEFGRQSWGFLEVADESPFSEAEEMELAMELLSVASEAELDQFLGKMFKGIWKGVKKVGSFVGKVAKPLGGALKAIAKQALPLVGGALGSMIPIPGVGTALGSALGSAVSQALEVELEGMDYEQREMEMARRFVRIAGSAARLAADGDGSPSALRDALAQAVRRHVPDAAAAHMQTGGEQEGEDETQSGRWRRRGNNIVVMGDW